MYMNIDIQSK